MDIFGFENCSPVGNSLEQLCINTANEQMNYYFHQFLFIWEREEYLVEDIVMPQDQIMQMEMPSYRHVLNLILNRPIGIMSLLDEESKFPSSNDNTLSAKLNANLAGNPAYEQPR